jgi:hypothetical protein
MKKPVRKLSLDKTTVRHLTELRGVAGGDLSTGCISTIVPWTAICRESRDIVCYTE